MITIYHNPRCSKSREGLSVIENSGKKINKVLYLENNLTYFDLESLITLLKIRPIDLVRKNESIWKEDFKDKNLTDQELIQVMVDNPKLIERPIVVFEDKAVIGRPIEKIIELIK